MKRYTEYLNEDFDPAIYNSDGGISIDDPSVIDAINSNLDASTSCSFRTPYNALEEVRKILAYYKIFLPKSIFLDQNHGNDVFEISQFGEKSGINDNGEVVTASDSPLFVYFEWSLNEKGMYDIFTSIVDEDELDEVMDDFDAEMSSDEGDLQESMPDLKKKMDAKKVTLANRMKKTQNDNDKTYKDWRKDKPDLETTRKLVGEENIKEDDMDLFDDDKPKKEKKAKEYKHETSGKTIMHTGTPPKGFKLVKEQKLDELSRDFVSKYVKKAKKDKKTDRSSGIKLATLKKYGSDKSNLPKVKATMEESKQLDEISKEKLGQYIKAASHDVATKSAATGRYADRANRARDEMKKGDYKNWPQGKKDDEFADKMFKKSWNRRKGIAKATDKLTKEEKDVPFDNPTSTPSTPYKKPENKAKQLARSAMKAQKEKSEKK
jgi:hypothetical protein